MNVYARNYTLELYHAFRLAKLELDQLYALNNEYLLKCIKQTCWEQEEKTGKLLASILKQLKQNRVILIIRTSIGQDLDINYQFIGFFKMKYVLCQCRDTCSTEQLNGVFLNIGFF